MLKNLPVTKFAGITLLQNRIVSAVCASRLLCKLQTRRIFPPSESGQLYGNRVGDEDLGLSHKIVLLNYLSLEMVSRFRGVANWSAWRGACIVVVAEMMITNNDHQNLLLVVRQVKRVVSRLVGRIESFPVGDTRPEAGYFEPPRQEKGFNFFHFFSFVL